MSTSHDAPQAHAAPPRRSSQGSGPEPQPIQEIQPLTIQQLISKSEKLREQPDDAQQWLESLGPRVQNTLVPVRVAALHGTSAYLGKSCTFCEVLVDWISLWLVREDKLRKKFQKADQSRPNSDGSQLHWLLEFVNDYIKVSEGGISCSSLETMTATITQLCLNTKYHSDIAAAIPVLSSISENYVYPSEFLGKTIQILAASLIHVADASESIYACFHALATSKYQDPTINTLFEFVATPTIENNAKELTRARGALRLFRRLLGLNDSGGSPLLDVHRFTGALHLAARQQIFRYAVDILNACHAVLSSNENVNLTTEDFEEHLDTLRLCLAAPYPEGYDAPGTALSATNSAGSEFERGIDRHHRERETIATSVGLDIYYISQRKPDYWSTALIDFVLEYPLYSPDNQVIQCIDKSVEDKLLWPETPRWNDRCRWLQSKYVSDDSSSSDCRIHAIDVLRALISAFSEDENVRDTHRGNNDSLSWLVATLTDTVLLQIPSEECEAILDALYTLLPFLTMQHQTTEDGLHVGDRIIKALEGFVMRDLQLTSLGNESALRATKALVRILTEHFERSPTHTVHAFESLTNIASIQCKFRQSRIEAMRTLFRIRSTTDGCVYLSNVCESEYIATALCRTRSSAEAFEYELPGSQHHSASSTSLSTKSSSHECLWMYDEEYCTVFKSCGPSLQITVFQSSDRARSSKLNLDIGSWLLQVIHCLQGDQDWETHSFCLVNLGSQLGNISLFKHSLPIIVKLRQIVCDQLVRPSVRDPPAATGLKKSDVALCLYNILTPLIAYATMKSEVIQKEFGDDLVRAFLHGVASRNFEGTDRGCIHALSLCALEIPRSVASQYPNILERISTSITKSYLTLHILEFLSQVATLPEVHSNFLEEEIKQIFAICVQFLEKTREQNSLSSSALTARTSTPSRQSGISLKRPPYRAAMMKDVGEPRYASALAYHTIICWFLSLKLERRKVYVSWIVPRLAWKNSAGEEVVDEQSEVLVDMMQRTAFSDLGETLGNPTFSHPADGPVDSASWLVGYSIITAETAGRTGLTQITKRQASGTTHSIYQQSTTPLPPHHAPSLTAIRVEGAEENDVVEMLPPHILLQMVTTAAPTSVKDQPVALPREDYITRALSSFDRISTLDSYKAGVLFIGPGQARESEFLMLQSGSADYERFLKGLAFKVPLQPPLRFNPQGLLYPRDGERTIAWRDRVTEIVFLVPTMMPANEDEDPEWISKKAHVGNCHVNIIFNRSGKDWTFDNLPSDFNSINIIITPSDLIDDNAKGAEEKMSDFYRVQVQTKEHFPNILPAADPKIISAAQLPKFVRILAINANVFSDVWRTKEHDKEFPSAWRARLQAIKRLKEQVNARASRQDSSTSGPPSASGTTLSVGGGRRTPVPREDTAGGEHSDGALAMQLDFGRWTS